MNFSFKPQNPITCKFSEIAPGECFLNKTDIFIKTFEIPSVNSFVNAVRITDGVFGTFFDEEAEIQPLETNLICNLIYSKED